MKKLLVILLLFFSVHDASGIDTKFPYPDMDIKRDNCSEVILIEKYQ